MIGSKLSPIEVYKGREDAPEWFSHFLKHYAELTQAFITLRNNAIAPYTANCVRGVETRIFLGKAPRGAVLVSGRCVSYSVRVDKDSVFIRPVFKTHPSILKTWPTDSISIAGDVREDYRVGDVLDVNGARVRVTGVSVSRESQIVTNLKIDGKVQLSVGDLIRLDAEMITVLVFF